MPREAGCPGHRRPSSRLVESLRVQSIAQVAQSFADEVVCLEVVRGDERLHVAVYVEGTAVGGYIEGVEYGAEVAVRPLGAEGAPRVAVRRDGLIEEPPDGTKQRPHTFPLATEVVGQSGQDLVGLADVFVGVPDGALLVTAARSGCLAFGHR